MRERRPRGFLRLLQVHHKMKTTTASTPTKKRLLPPSAPSPPNLPSIPTPTPSYNSKSPYTERDTHTV